MLLLHRTEVAVEPGHALLLLFYQAVDGDSREKQDNDATDLGGATGDARVLRGDRVL